MARTGGDQFRDVREKDWPKGLYRRQDSYRYKRTVEGSKLFEVWGAMGHDDACRKAQRYNLDLADGRNPIQAQAARSMTLREFAYDVWLKMKSAKVRPSTVTKYRSVLDNFLYYLSHQAGLKEPRVGDITYAVASNYIVHRQTAPVMPNGSRKFTRAMKGGAARKTVMADRATLHQLFAEAARRGLTEASPFADISLKRPSRDEVRRKHNPLSATQVRSLLDACVEMDQDTAGDESPSFHDIVFALVNTGMREAELLNLEWSDVIWDRGVICVQAKHVTETRLVALSPGQVRALRQFANGRAAGEPLFASAEHLARLGVRLPLRRTEDLMSLRVGDVDFSKGTLASVRNYEWKPKATEGEIPMSAKVTQLLHGLHAKATGNFVFGHGDGGSCRLRLLRLLKRAQKKAGIPGNLRVHDLRHTTAVLLRRRGVPLETIMGILRHADIRETLIYAPYSLAEGRQAIAKLDDIYDI